MSPHNSDGRVPAFQAGSVGSSPTVGSKTIGVCEDCGEVELDGWPPGMSVFALGTDFERWKVGDFKNSVFFYCKCGKKAYLKD